MAENEPPSERALRLYREGDASAPENEAYTQALLAAEEARLAGSTTAASSSVEWHIHFLRGNHARALSCLDAMEQLSPGTGQVSYHRGLTYERLGDEAEARSAFLEAKSRAEAADDDELLAAIEHHL